MTFKIDYLEGDVYRWSTAEEGATVEVDDAYTPACYVSARSGAALASIRGHLGGHHTVVDASVETWRTVWRDDPETVLRLDCRTLAGLRRVASEVRGWGDPGEYRLFDVDFTRQFRYCLDRGIDPAVDAAALSIFELELAPKAHNDGDVGELCVDGEPADGDAADALDAVETALADRDPDVLVVSSGELVPLLYRAAEACDRPAFELGRRPGWERLAAASTFESYGRVGHSPARYDVPGRVILDASTSFFWRQTNLAGLCDLVERSRKPLQETAWASIGNVLTAIQVRIAREHGVLTPWNSWRHEQFKPMSTLHEADRGGFIFSPAVGVHEDVHELDFSSLYPKIMVTRNVSPETINCECHPDRKRVPCLDYTVCAEPGYITEVLEPIVEDRDAFKAAIEALEAGGSVDAGRLCETDDLDPAALHPDLADAERIETLQGKADALKWILVSCFGYQGFSNAKFGRIECHEAINAFAREILLDAKETLEKHGWAVVHGIVDSLWVRAIPGAEQTPLEAVAEAVTADAGIELEYEAAFEWIAFASRREGDGGALNRYVGKRVDGGFKVRGVELRQRSTPAFVADCQREWLELLDDHRSPARVCDRLRIQLAALRAGRVDPADLLIRQRVSKEVDEYDRRGRNVAALERADVQSFDVSPGEDVAYVVVDDEARAAARVRLAYEPLERYDAEFYATLLIRTAESVCSPFGWDRERIRRYLAETEDATVTAY